VKATRCQLDELRREKWGKILDDVHEFAIRMIFANWK
jgi:hypothetical protein